MRVGHADAFSIEAVLDSFDLFGLNTASTCLSGIDPDTAVENDRRIRQSGDRCGRFGIVEDAIDLVGLFDDDLTSEFDVGVVLDAEVERHPARLVGDRVLDDRVGQIAVRHRHLFVVERIELRHAEVDLPDDAVVAVPLDVITDLERFVLEDEDP